MLSSLVLAWGVLAGSLSVNPPARPAVNYADIAWAMSYPGVDVTVTWRDCGAVNAFYIPREKSIVMCNELLESVDTGTIRFMFAHEFAHAILSQLAIPFTVSEEATADELAAYALVLSGSERDLSAAADWFATKVMAGYYVPPTDDHPDHLKRAVMLKCFSFGRAAPRECPRNFDRVIWTWNTLLKIDND